jgi:hypothetical protein
MPAPFCIVGNIKGQILKFRPQRTSEENELHRAMHEIYSVALYYFSVGL